MSNMRSVGTHDGTFHADEVVVCALLVLFDLVDRSRIVRTRDPKKLAQCEYVCDVGGVYDPARKCFDHHQVDYTGELSSAGMVLQFLLKQGIIDEELYRFFNRSLILGIDAHDNGKMPLPIGWCTFSNVISNFAPISYAASAAEQEAAFFAAFEFALGHLRRLLERWRYLQKCRQKVAEAMAPKERYLLFEEPLPWLENFFELGGEAHPALFVVMPSGSHWKLRGIPPTLEQRMEVRHPLPQEWAGLSESDLTRVSQIPGAMFCHKGRFISVWETKKAVLQALEKVLSKQ